MVNFKLIGMGALLLCTSGVFVGVQDIEAQSPGVVLRRGTDDKSADKPSKSPVVHLPGNGELGGESGLPPSEGSGPPSEPSSGYEEDDGEPPSYFGEEIKGQLVFVIDVSASMQGGCSTGSMEDYDGNTVSNPRKIQVLKYETVRVLKLLGKNDYLDFVQLAGVAGGSRLTPTWKGELVPMDDSGKTEAIEFIKGMDTWVLTPTYPALQKACTIYGSEINRFLFLSDGAPVGNLQVWGKSFVLADLPGWYQPLRDFGCTMSVIHIGREGGDREFMRNCAELAGGTFVAK